MQTMQPGQLNVYSFRNQNTDTIQNVKLFEAEEMRAYLVVMPPGSTIDTHEHANTNELFDVVEGEGQFVVDGRTFRGDSGKCVFVPAGARLNFSISSRSSIKHCISIRIAGSSSDSRISCRRVMYLAASCFG